MITIFTSNEIGNPRNVIFPMRVDVTDLDSMRRAVGHDYVCAAFQGNRRGNETFLVSNCLAVDVDNDPDDPSLWVRPEDVAQFFPGVRYYVARSRHDMKEKDGASARPRFHVFFEIDPVASADEYCAMKGRVLREFPYADRNAMDAARFFFGTPNPDVDFFDGPETLSHYLSELEFDSEPSKIPEGSRNSTMSRFAARVLKKYGDDDEARQAFDERSAACDPPLGAEELESIWRSALSFYREKIVKSPSYVPPERYNDPNSYRPGDYSDVGQAEVMAKYYGPKLCYSEQTHFMVYRVPWVESDIAAQAMAQDLTRHQMKEARRLLGAAAARMKETGASDAVAGVPKQRAASLLSGDKADAYAGFNDAKAYAEWSVGRRDSKAITNTLKELHPLVEVRVSALDSNPYLLCTPEGTYDIRKGASGRKDNDPADLITRITSKSPSEKGREEWEASLSRIFGDPGLIQYVQRICGVAALGEVRLEALIIAYGDGGNGKSTFWNAVARSLGTYSGNISAETLTVGSKRNAKPELAEIRGKRLLIAAESQEGARLNDSMLKQLCSTDEILAEKKYKDPFSFKPSHTLVLYTNHLPKVSASDDGTWRRFIVIPFTNKLTGSGDIKNYGERLYENCGEYIVKWVLEGARQAYELGYEIPMPPKVEEAIREYRSENDWFRHFLDDECVIGKEEREASAEIYRRYVSYCMETNERPRCTADFYKALDSAPEGFRRLTMKRKRYYCGLRLATDFEREGDE